MLLGGFMQLCRNEAHLAMFICCHIMMYMQWQNVDAVTREPQCSNTSCSFNAPTASILEDTHTLMAQWTGQNTSASSFAVLALPAIAQAAIKRTNSGSAVVVGHSAGGRVALDVVTGTHSLTG